MSAKLIQYWNIRHRFHEEFNAFFSQKFITGINETGLMQILGSWHTASGEEPYFVVEGLSDSLDNVESLVMGETFQTLRQELMHLVSDYRTKLLVPRSGIRTDSIQVEKGFKFTQHFNINAADNYAFDSFFNDIYVPDIKRRGIDLVGDWNVAVGATPYVVIETRAASPDVFGQLLEDPAYLKLTQDLLNMVSGYGCKILVPSGHLNN